MLVSTDITDHQQFATEEIYLHFIFNPLCEYISLYINLTCSPGPYVAATSPVGLECLFYAMCKNQLLMV